MGVRPSPDEILRVRDALYEIDKFSYHDVPLPDGALLIRDALLESTEPLADVLADEWAFLTSQSVAVIRADAEATLEAFERAGVRVYRVSNEMMERGLQAIRRRLPPRLLRVMKRFGWSPSGSLAKTVVLAGEIGALFVPVVGLPLAIVGAVREGTAIIAGDP